MNRRILALYYKFALISATFLMVFYRIVPGVTSCLKVSLLSALMLDLFGKAGYIMFSMAVFILLYFIYIICIVRELRLYSIVLLTCIFIFEGMISRIDIVDMVMYLVLMVMILNFNYIIKFPKSLDVIFNVISIILSIVVLIIIPYIIIVLASVLMSSNPVLSQLAMVYFKSKILLLLLLFLGLYIAWIIHERIRGLISYLLRGIHLSDVIDENLYKVGVKGVIPLSISGFERVLVELMAFISLIMLSPYLTFIVEIFIKGTLVTVIIVSILSFISWLFLRLLLYKLYDANISKISINRSHVNLMIILITTLLLIIMLFVSGLFTTIFLGEIPTWSKYFNEVYVKYFNKLKEILGLLFDILLGG